MDKIKLSVTEIASIVGLSPRTLRYYLSIGLIEASYIDPDNGYHYFYIGKIEELRFIMYLRNLGIPIKEISLHLKTKDLNHYEVLLSNQLTETEKMIEHLNLLAHRLKKRMHAIEEIRALPKLETIIIKKLPSRKILKIDRRINGILDLETAMLEFEKSNDLPPSLCIGDLGFFIDLKSPLDHNFTGIYLFADDEELMASPLLSTLPSGNWLSIHFEGQHENTLDHYQSLLQYAVNNGLKLDDFALERVLIDHTIAGNLDIGITEIEILIKNNHKKK